MHTDEENEYEVESIVQARIEKQRGKLIWKLCVKWKGYDNSENTWEPVESFEGSENLLDQFWQRIDTGGRDVNNLRLFSFNENFHPIGPPRHKKNRKTVKKDRGPEAAVSNEGSKTRTEKRRRSLSGEAEAPSKKRSRGQVDSGKPSAPISKSRKTLLLPGSGIEESRTSLTERKLGQTVSVSRRRIHQSSSDVAASEDSEDEIMRDYLVEHSGDETSRPVTNGSSNSQPGSQLQPQQHERPSKYRNTKIVLDEPNDNNAADSPDIADSPLFDDPDDPFPEDTDKGNLPTSSTSVAPTGSSLVPSHRARTANPLVKLVDPTFHGMDGSISTKARLLGRISGPAQSDLPAGPSHNGRSSEKLPSWQGSNPKARAGKPPKGLQKNKSSLLTFQKGALKTVKGKYVTPTADDTITTGVAAAESSGNGGTFSEIAWDNRQADTDAAASDSIPGIPNYKPSDTSSQPVPKGEELLRAAGLDIKEAEALPDFEEDAPAAVTVPEEDSAPEEPTTSILQQSLALARDNLLPGVLSSTSVTNAVNAVWKRSTIFGPLGLGTDVPKLVASGSVTSTQTFFLALDPSVSIPILLNDITIPSTGSPSLDHIVSNCSSGPPGKFYCARFAQTLLDTLRTGGSSARIQPEENMSDEQKRYFDTFCERLNSGEMFVALAGGEVLAFCSSNNALIGQRLNIPPALLGSLDDILVTQVVIEKYSAYADAAAHADSIRL